MPFLEIAIAFLVGLVLGGLIIAALAAGHVEDLERELYRWERGEREPERHLREVA